MIPVTMEWHAQWAALRGTRRGAAFIVGSGPSIGDNDFRWFADRDIIAMNHAVWLAPDGTIGSRYWALVDWPESFREYVRAAIHRGFTVVRDLNHIDPPWFTHERLLSVNSCDTPGHSIHSTLDLALGLAVHLGYRRAYLIACDGGQENFFYDTSRTELHRAKPTTTYAAVNESAIWSRQRAGLIDVFSTGAKPSPFAAYHDVRTALEYDMWARNRHDRAVS